MKRLFALALCFALIIPQALAVGTADWPAWGQEALDWAREVSISEAYLSAPGQTVTRADAAQLLYEAAGRPAVDGDCPFSDVSGDAAPAITWAAEQGYIDGQGDGTFAPDTAVERQAFAAILYRQAGSPALAGDLGAYSDRGQVDSWAEKALAWCVQTGLMNGKTADTLAPGDTITVAEAVAMLQRAGDLSDVSGIREDLEVLTAQPRPIGSQGEADAAEYIARRFEEMGYTVTRQPYTDESGRTGTNVIAVKEAVSSGTDILVLSAHHDSVPAAYGANDNASGVAALLYTAEALKDVEGGTEIRFISFTDEENGKNGSRAYVESLSENEKARMVGDIQFDMLGGLGTEDTVIATVDGEPNWVSDLLQEKDPSLALTAESASDHTSFQLAEVPSVMLMQKDRGYLYHTAADTADQLNPYAIASAAETAVAAAEDMLSDDPPMDWERLRMEGSGYTYTYRQTRQNVIYFSASLRDTEAYVGASGELVDTNTVSGEGWTDTYETYRYSMRWFDGETPMNTYYQYRNGFLQSIEIRPYETGYTAEQVRGLIEAMYGQPTADSAESTGWADIIYSKYITLTPGEGTDCTVSVGSYSLGLSNVLSSYEVVNGEAEITDSADKAVWDYLCAILPLEYRQKIAQFNLFTDGYSNVLAYTAPMENEDGTNDNTRFAITIDYYDVYDENGEKRDWSKLTYTILHEYGHVLLEDESQVDLSGGGSTHDPACFVEGSFRKEFYDRFWADLGDTGVNDYAENPTKYVSQYGANYFHEDIADTFAVFVLGGQPKGDTVAAEKVRFFWADANMVALRTALRERLGLVWSEGDAPADTSSELPAQAAVADLAQLQAELTRAIANAEQPPALKVSSLQSQADLPLTVKNLYYDVLSQHPEYKYAYDLTAEIGSDGLLYCTVSYMPYRTGDYPADFQGEEVASLAGLVQTALAGLGRENTPIRITDPTLAVDEMNKALQQVGGGWLLCQLSRDGTAITTVPQGGLTHDEALERLEESEALATQIYEDAVTKDMTQTEQAEALYAWLTEQVTYDHRYYSAPAAMPYASTTAYGALHDHTAICGGYAQALQLLFRQAGIPCITVSGKMGGENHMWDLAQIDGQWRYFDATSDRGRADYGFLYFGVEGEALTRYTWDQSWAEALAERLSF